MDSLEDPPRPATRGPLFRNTVIRAIISNVLAQLQEFGTAFSDTFAALHPSAPSCFFLLEGFELSLAPPCAYADSRVRSFASAMQIRRPRCVCMHRYMHYQTTGLVLLSILISVVAKDMVQVRFTDSYQEHPNAAVGTGWDAG